MPKEDILHPIIVLSVMVNEFEKSNNDIDEIKISTLENAKCNIGKVFNLDNLSIANYLDKLQALGYLKVVRTAGLDYVKFTNNLTFESCVEKYYATINE